MHDVLVVENDVEQIVVQVLVFVETLKLEDVPGPVVEMLGWGLVAK